MTRARDICNAVDCTVSPGGDVGGVARPAVCWRCRGDAAPVECAEGGCECEPRTCMDCDVALPAGYLADACLTCIALGDGEPIRWDDGYPAREVGR